MTKTNLLPCPFCGCEDIDEYEGDYGNGVYCMNCGAMMGEQVHREFHVQERVAYEQAAEAWNTRAELGAATLDGGRLTAEQVGKAMFGSCVWDEDSAMYYVSYTDMQAIADELNAALGGGECENVSDEPQHFQCSECSSRGIVRKVFDNRTKFSFCPDCGAKVRKAVER